MGDGGNGISVNGSGAGVWEVKLACKGACGGWAWGLTGRHGGGKDRQEGG